MWYGVRVNINLPRFLAQGKKVTAQSTFFQLIKVQLNQTHWSFFPLLNGRPFRRTVTGEFYALEVQILNILLYIILKTVIIEWIIQSLYKSLNTHSLLAYYHPLLSHEHINEQQKNVAVWHSSSNLDGQFDFPVRSGFSNNWFDNHAILFCYSNKLLLHGSQLDVSLCSLHSVTSVRSFSHLNLNVRLLLHVSAFFALICPR